MGFSQSYGPAKDEESLQTLATAVELGCTFWDSAAVYGVGHNESLLGRFFKENPGSREKVFLASKCGLEVGTTVVSEAAAHMKADHRTLSWCDFEAKKTEMKVNNSAAHIKQYIEGSIERLGSAPDLYYLHRIEPGRPLEESINALNDLKKAGKFAHIDALQIEYSPWFTDHEQNGLIDTAKELGVSIIAFSPLGKGILTGAIHSASDFKDGDFRKNIPRFSQENLSTNMRIVREFQKLAEKKGCTSGQLALAWVIAQGAIPIPGTKSADRLTENFGARNVDLSKNSSRNFGNLWKRPNHRVTGTPMRT
ncbi:hypothetical protein QFC22_003239 [Naganishia vaughanmartiniae]|uniref:Uncharacterized protein n=1 Tax=Naganishia vaughanmartiniae TaxID=1424756 RepID=A0ACC2X646_9TREE|nr:hypothetical protein QFC22_003239 [Naganishia vaughanmartiniae]